jgi:hypothetical protein
MVVRITVSLTPAEHAELRAVAGRARVSLSWMVRQAVTEFLERQRDEAEQLPLHLRRSRRTLRSEG